MTDRMKTLMVLGAVLTIALGTLIHVYVRSRRRTKTQRFLSAIEDDNVEALKKCVADPIAHRSGDFSRTPLMYAARSLSPRIVTYLIQNGADVNTRDTTRRTALMLAVKHNGYYDPERFRPVITALLNAGADVNARDAEGATALMYAAAQSRIPTKILPMLLQAGADVNIKDGAGMTAVNYLEYSPTQERSEAGRKDTDATRELLRAEGANVEGGRNVNTTVVSRMIHRTY